MWPASCELAHPNYTPPAKLPVWYCQPEGMRTRHRRHEDDRQRYDVGSNSRHRHQDDLKGVAHYADGGRTRQARHSTHISAPALRGNQTSPSVADSSAESPRSEASSQMFQTRKSHRHRRRPHSSPGFVDDWDYALSPAVTWAATRPGRDVMQPPAGAGQLTQDFRMTAPHLLTHSRSLPGRLGCAADVGGWGHTLNAGFGRSDRFTNNAFFQTGRQSHGPDLRQIAHTSPNHVTRVC